MNSCLIITLKEFAIASSSFARPEATNKSSCPDYMIARIRVNIYEMPVFTEASLIAMSIKAIIAGVVSMTHHPLHEYNPFITYSRERNKAGLCFSELPL